MQNYHETDPEFAERLISEHTLLIIVDTHKASFVEAPEI